MRRRLLGVLLSAAVLLALCAGALAEGAGQAYTANLGDWMDRVKLRASPSQSAAVLGQYFAGVTLTVLGTQGEWSQVRVDTREGYMMSRYLTRGLPDAQNRVEGIPGFLDYPAADGSLPLLAEPRQNAEVLCLMSADLEAGRVTVLGTVGDAWLHVRWYKMDNQAVTGFADSTAITQSENMSTVVVDTGVAENRLHLRASPSQSAASLGRYYSGTRMSRLFDDHTNGDGWERVRVLDKVGYMMDRYLDDSSGGEYQFAPPLTVARKSSIPLFASADATTATDTISNTDRVAVLGECGARYAVRVETDVPDAYRYGYVDQASVKTVTRAARVTGTVRTAQPLLRWDSQQGGTLDDIVAPKGAQLYVCGSAPQPGGPDSRTYLWQGMPWVLCDVEFAENSWATGYLPMDAVTLDMALIYPTP